MPLPEDGATQAREAPQAGSPASSVAALPGDGAVQNPDFTEFARTCCVAIQGGGAYGVALMGMLAAVEEFQIIPHAIAGTSAGAIVATLYWAGYSPREILALFKDLASRDQLMPLVGPPDPHSEQPVQPLLDLIRSKKWLSKIFDLYPFYAKFRKDGGLYSGKNLRDQFEIWLRQPNCFFGKIPPLHARQRRPGPLERIRISDVYKNVVEDNDGFLPLLLLPVTNLEKSEPDVISFRKAERLLLSDVVRASAGFPFFFTPHTLCTYDPGADAYKAVDGGIFMNFPAHTFIGHWRKLMRAGEARRPSLPYTTIGLQLAYDNPRVKVPNGVAVLKQLLKLLTGENRNYLEDQLSKNCCYPISLSHKVTEPDFNVLAFDRLSENGVIDRIFEQARNDVREQLGHYSFLLPVQDADTIPIFNELLALRENIARFLQISSSDVRAAIFVASISNSTGHLRLASKYTSNMNSAQDADRDFVFEMDQGATGHAFMRRQSVAANLHKVDFFLASGHAEVLDLFNFDANIQSRVRNDRSALFCQPLFDPHELGQDLLDPIDYQNPNNRPPSFGMLDVDTSFKRWNNYGGFTRAFDIIGPIIEASARTISRHLSKFFARKN